MAKSVETRIEDVQASLPHVGMAASVNRGSDVIWQSARGWADLQAQRPYSCQSVQNIGSISKVFAGLSVLCLERDNLARLDDPVMKHLPEFGLGHSAEGRMITLRDILSYRVKSNLPEMLYYFLDAACAADGRLAYLSSLNAVDLAFPLRTGFGYCDELFGLVALVAERVSGLPWRDYAAKAMFGPLEMTSTSCRLGDHASAVEVYQRDAKGDQIRIAPTYMSLNAAFHDTSGGVNSTADDLCRALLALQGHPKAARSIGLDPQEIRGLFRLHTADDMGLARRFDAPGVFDPRFDSHGVGWHLHSYRGRFLVEKTGANPGIRTIMGFLPDSEIAVCVLSNSDASDAHRAVFLTLLDAFAFPDASTDWGRHFALPESSIADDRSTLAGPIEFTPERWAGRWRMKGPVPLTLDLRVDGNDHAYLQSGEFRWRLAAGATQVLVIPDMAFLGPNYNSGSMSTESQIFLSQTAPDQLRMTDGNSVVFLHRHS